jgi:hypothetical protein
VSLEQLPVVDAAVVHLEGGVACGARAAERAVGAFACVCVGQGEQSRFTFLIETALIVISWRGNGSPAAANRTTAGSMVAPGSGIAALPAAAKHARAARPLQRCPTRGEGAPLMVPISLAGDPATKVRGGTGLSTRDPAATCGRGGGGAAPRLGRRQTRPPPTKP